MKGAVANSFDEFAFRKHRLMALLAFRIGANWGPVLARVMNCNGREWLKWMCFRFVDGETEPRFECAERADVGAGQVAVAFRWESEQSGDGQHEQHSGLHQIVSGHDQDPGERPGGQPAPVPRRSIPAQVSSDRRRPPPAGTRRPGATDHPHRKLFFYFFKNLIN